MSAIPGENQFNFFQPAVQEIISAQRRMEQTGILENDVVEAGVPQTALFQLRAGEVHVLPKSAFQEAVLPERVGEGAVAAVGTVQVALFKAGEAEIAVLDLGPSKDRVLKV